MITLNEFENFLYTDLVYEQKIVSVIDDQHRQILIENIRQLHDYTNCTIKLEQMEKYNEGIFEKEIINEEKSLILSFGFEKFYTEKLKLNYGIDVLPQDDRNL